MIKNCMTLFNGLALLCFSFPALAMLDKDGKPGDNEPTSILRHRKPGVNSLAENMPKETALKNSLASVLPKEVVEGIATFLCQDQKGLLKAAAVCHSWRAVAEKICNDPNQPYPKYLNLGKFPKPYAYPFIVKFLICQYNLAAWAHGSDLMPIQPPQPPQKIVYTSYDQDVGLFSQPKTYWISGKFIKEVFTFSKKKEQEGRGGCVYFDVPCDPFVLETSITSSDCKEIEDCQLFRASYSSSVTASWKIEGKVPYGKTFILKFRGDELLDE